MSSDLERFLRAVRTLAKLAHKHSHEAFLEALGRHASVEQEGDVWFVGTFLDDLGRALDERRVKDDLRCCVCGRDIEDVRTDAQYCSSKCRQKAYRSRVTAGTTTKTERKRNGNCIALRLAPQKQRQAVTNSSPPAAEPQAAAPDDGIPEPFRRPRTKATTP